ncbi:hypothetical protein SHIRM173S_06717 [Streptomyces hirsutus]
MEEIIQVGTIGLNLASGLCLDIDGDLENRTRRRHGEPCDSSRSQP